MDRNPLPNELPHLPIYPLHQIPLSVLASTVGDFERYSLPASAEVDNAVSAYDLLGPSSPFFDADFSRDLRLVSIELQTMNPAGITRSNNPGTYHSTVRRWPALTPSESCPLPSSSSSSFPSSPPSSSSPLSLAPSSSIASVLSRLHVLLYAAISSHHLKVTRPPVSRVMEFKPPEYWLNVSPGFDAPPTTTTTSTNTTTTITTTTTSTTPTGGHALHDHCGATYSGVLYVDDGHDDDDDDDDDASAPPPNGLLLIRTGVSPSPAESTAKRTVSGSPAAATPAASPAPAAERTRFDCDLIPLRAVTGVAYIFSGGTPHAVSPYTPPLPGRKRISLSFNFFIGTGSHYS